MSALQHNFVRVLFYSMIGLLFICSTSANAQERNSQIDIKVKRVKFAAKLIAMSDMIAILSEKSGCSIVVDDEPLRKLGDIDIDGTVQEALDRIAQTFDYTWTLSKQGVVLMSKAFNNPKEIPQMNLPEMRQMARTAIAALNSFPCDLDRMICYTQANLLFKSFSKEQAANLQQGVHLRLKDLTPDQAVLLQRLVTNEVLAGALTQWKTLLAGLDAVPTANGEYRESESDYSFWFAPAERDARILLSGGRKDRQ